MKLKFLLFSSVNILVIQFLCLNLTKYESMKNMLKYVVPAILGLFATLWNQTAAAAIDAKISF